MVGYAKWKKDGVCMTPRTIAVMVGVLMLVGCSSAKSINEEAYNLRRIGEYKAFYITIPNGTITGYYKLQKITEEEYDRL